MQDSCGTERVDALPRIGASAAQPRRVIFVAAGLRCGGIERALVSLASGLLARGHHVTVITYSAADTDFFTLPQNVARISLNIRVGAPTPFLQLFSTTRARLQALRVAIEANDPDIVIAHAPQINVPTLLAMRGSAVPVIVTEHGDVPVRPEAARPWLWKKWAWYQLRRHCYPRAFKVVSVSKAIDRSFAWLPKERREVIHNPLPLIAPQLPTPPDLPPGLDPHRPWIVSMGRLSHAKGHDVLLTAFALVAARFPQWQLVIIGDGELRKQLHRLAGELMEKQRVIFTGALASPFALLCHAQFFVLASRYEGFPMAVAEALACGLPVIAADSPSRPRKFGERGFVAGGIRELVRDGIDGLLVPRENPVALADAITRWIENPQERRHLAQQAASGITRFSHEQVVEDWERLVEQALAAGHHRRSE
jgi:GalNAc-alpha-(1->4)-GalNAc-alpha-(1->3)-diNAcBac-PP-undecaprenol alpha-1,4-N-acetyl-D-galactosaminyltransferase